MNMMKRKIRAAKMKNIDKKEVNGRRKERMMKR